MCYRFFHDAAPASRATGGRRRGLDRNRSLIAEMMPLTSESLTCDDAKARLSTICAVMRIPTEEERRGNRGRRIGSDSRKRSTVPY